jgi:magnesium-transporting ATPase (P-type)
MDATATPTLHAGEGVTLAIANATTEDMYYSGDYTASDADYTTGDDYMTDGYYTETGWHQQEIDPAATAAMAGVGLVVFLIWFAVIVLMLVSMWKIFTKAGQPGWASIIPIYNAIVLLQIVNKPIWWIVLLFIPFVNFVVIIMIYHALSKAFGKGVEYTLGLIFLNIIFFPMLAFGSATYTKPLQPMTPPMPNPTPPMA